MPLEWPVGVSRPCERASFVHGRGCESDLSTPLGPVGTPVNRLRGRYSPVAVSTLSLRDPADPPPEGTSREQALAANSGNVWQTSNADFAVNPGFGNVWQRVEKPPPNFASRRSPVRSRLAPSKEYLQIARSVTVVRLVMRLVLILGHVIGPHSRQDGIAPQAGLEAAPGSRSGAGVGLPDRGRRLPASQVRSSSSHAAVAPNRLVLIRPG